MIARLNVGGAALHVLQLAHEQQRRGHDVIVVTGTLAAGEESMEYVADELAVTVRKVPALQRELSLRADAGAILAIRRILLEAKPTCSTHTPPRQAQRVGSPHCSPGNNRPRSVVHTYHGHVLRGYFDARRERVFRLGPNASSPARLMSLIAVSDQVRDDLVCVRRRARSALRVVPYGFDLPAWSDADDEARARVRAELGLDEETFVVGWAGRLTRSSARST